MDHAFAARDNDPNWNQHGAGLVGLLAGPVRCTTVNSGPARLFLMNELSDF
jgi:hypothetical protein